MHPFVLDEAVSLPVLLYPCIIFSPHAATVNHPREYLLFGHDASAYLPADGATAVTLPGSPGDNSNYVSHLSVTGIIHGLADY
jgi:hypothetical protein